MALQEVGVEAVVRGLSAFQGDIRAMNNSLQNLRGEGTFLQQMFGAVGDAIIGFGESIVRVAEITLGVLLRDAILAVTESIKEMISATIEAGIEFQGLEVRLERLNFNDLVESGEDYEDAGKQAVQMTQEQLDWLQKLAAVTPYGPEDVSNVYTLARSYGFAADEAASLTEDILNFAAGMNLTDQQLERIIINFGQMIQQGKLNGQELRDLARGAFVPVNDILEIMMGKMTAAGTITEDFTEEIDKESEKLKDLQNDLAVALQKQSEFTEETAESTKMANQFKIEELQRKIAQSEELIRGYQASTGKAVEITAENFDDLKKKGLLTGEAVQLFIESFSSMVDEKWGGAAEKMGRTFKAATDNIRETTTGLFGLYTVKPVLDVIGDRIASFAESFTKTENWDKLVDAASRLGDALSSVVTGILDLLPSTGDIATTVIDLVDQAAAWVEDNRENIIGFFKGIGDTIQNEVVPFIRDNLIPAIMDFVGWIVENKEEIIQFFRDLATTIIEDVVPFVRDDLIPALQHFADWFIENKDLILELFDQLGDAVLELADFFLPKLEEAMQWIEENPEKVQGMIDAWGKWQVIGSILNIVGGILLGVGGFVLALVSGVSGLIGVFQFLAGLLSGPIKFVLLGLWATIGIIKAEFRILTNSVELWKDTMARVGEWLSGWIEDLKEAFASGNFSEIGKAIVDGIVAGMEMSHQVFLDAIGRLMEDAWEVLQEFWIFGSPSKRTFKAGVNIMQGMALGIQKSAGLAAMSMQSAMASVSSASMPSMTNSTTYNNTSNYNLTVNSAAQQEPIMQDFSMMESLAGV